jgi:hypothetical protein
MVKRLAAEADGLTRHLVKEYVDGPDGGRECTGDAREKIIAAYHKELSGRTAKQAKVAVTDLVRIYRDKKGIGLIKPEYTNKSKKRKSKGELTSEANSKDKNDVNNPKNKQRPL